MKRLLVFVLVVTVTWSLGLAWMLNKALEYERSKPLILEAGYNPQTGDVMVRERLPDGSYRGATFRKMCPRSMFN